MKNIRLMPLLCIFFTLLFIKCKSPENKFCSDRIVGFGYDVTREYAISSQVKEPVLDIKKLVKDEMISEDPNIETSEFESKQGRDIHEYQDALSKNVSASLSADFPGCAFKGEAAKNFSKEIISKRNYVFVTTRSNIAKSAIFVKNRSYPKQLRQYTTDEFREDLIHLEASEIIQKYGTHVMLGAIYGARLDYSMTYENKSNSSISDIGSYVSAEARGRFITGEVAAQAEKTSNSEKYKFDKNNFRQTRTRAIGGKTEYANDVQNFQNYTPWIESIEGNSVWCDYYANSLQPLYEFVDEKDIKKRRNLQKAISEYISSKKVIIEKPKPLQQVKHDYIQEAYTLQGASFENITIEGDDEIGSWDKKPIDYSYFIEVKEHGLNEVVANIEFTVIERGYDTTIKCSKQIPISIKGRLKSLNNGKILKIRKNDSISANHHNYQQTSIKCNWLHDVKIKVDGNGGDKNNVGISFKLNIPYAYN